MTTDVAQCKHSNIKCYASAFSTIQIQIKIILDEQLSILFFPPSTMCGFDISSVMATFVKILLEKSKGTYNCPPYTRQSYFQTSKQPVLQFSSENIQTKLKLESYTKWIIINKFQISSPTTNFGYQESKLSDYYRSSSITQTIKLCESSNSVKYTMNVQTPKIKLPHKVCRK